jgi:hypothetical protein
MSSACAAAMEPDTIATAMPRLIKIFRTLSVPSVAGRL